MTLTEASYWTRRFGVLALFGIALFVVFVIVVLNIQQQEAPPEYLKPNFACTDLGSEFTTEKLTIPTLQLAEGSDRVFQLETETGKVDSLPRVINVHKFNNLGQSLNSQSEAKILASKMGFDPDKLQRRGSAEYMWYDPATFRTLVVNARTLNFTMTTDFTKPSSIDTTANLPSDSEAKALATSYLRGKGILFEDYFAQIQTVNINIAPDGSFSQARSKAEAELVRVDFYREKPIISIRSDITGAQNMKETLEAKQLQAVTESILTDNGRIDIFNFNTVVTFENPNKPNISVYVGPQNKRMEKSGDNANLNVYTVSFTYWPLESMPCGTYQLIPPSSALQMVQNGQGSLVYLNEKNGDDVVPYTPRRVTKFTIYTINLGYYESATEQKFLQPVYIISGEATLDTGVVGLFHYYIPAIDYDSVGDKVILEDAPVERGVLF